MKKLLTSLLFFIASTAMAWPTKDITLVVPYPPGGPADITARIYQKELEKILKVNVNVRNMPGPAASAGIAHIMNSENDDHTFLHVGDDFVSGQHINGTKMYDQFTPVHTLGRSPAAMLVGGPGATQEKLLAEIKAGNPINVATINFPNIFSLWTQSISSNPQIKFNVVPYKGTADILRDVMAGHVTYGVLTLATAGNEDLVTAGKITPVLHSGDPRYKNIPSMRDLKMTVIPVSGYIAMFARKNTSPAAVAGMSTALKRVVEVEGRDAINSVMRFQILNLDAKDTEKFVAQEIVTIDRLLENAKIPKNVR